MKKEFSKNWIKSKQPRKQHKFKYNAPLHVKQKFLHGHLSKELQETSNRRSFGIKKGDKVRIMRGQFKGKSGKVERVSIKTSRIYINGIEIVKKDGSKTQYPIHVSNIMIENITFEDKKRKTKFNLKSSKEKSVDKNDKKSS